MENIVLAATVNQTSDFWNLHCLNLKIKVPFDFDNKDVKSLFYQAWSNSQNVPPQYSEAYQLIAKLKELLSLHEFILGMDGVTYVQVLSKATYINAEKIEQLRSLIPGLQSKSYS